MLGLTQKDFWRIAPVVAATLVVGVGTYFVGLSAISDMQRSHAEYVAKSFARHLLGEVPRLGDILDGLPPHWAGEALIGNVKPIGTIVSFSVFDRAGVLRAGSELEPLREATRRRPESDAVAASVLATQRVAFSLKEGDGATLPRYYSDISIPLLDGRRTIGVLHVVSDETETWPGLFDEFRNVLFQVVGLITFAFGIPLVMYLQKTGQLAKASVSLRQSTQYDALTGCLNRATFTRILQELIEGADTRDLAIAVHFIDLDRFNDVNESMGHEVGDELLKAAAQRLRRLTGTRERISRLGADEFAICQPYYVNSPQVVVELADDIVKALAKPFEVGGRTIQIGASVGYSHYPRDGKNVADLMRAADIAIHKAKYRARGRAVAFDPAMEVERLRRQAIEQRMREALLSDDFDIHFQPQYEVTTGKLRGFEALLRLSEPDGTPIPPAEFIPIAEEVDLIGDIGAWVLRLACLTARDWPDDLTVSVNMSPAQFAGSDIARQVAEVLAWSELPSRRLELEITESVLITETEKVLAELRAIKSLGVAVALDDFGTGYSSLSYLWRFPFDKLKVDKSFMADLAVEGSKSREILSTIIALGKVLDLEVTAEGVETEAQVNVLHDLRCDLAQGYLLGRPMHARDVAATVLKDMGTSRMAEMRARDAPTASSAVA